MSHYIYTIIGPSGSGKSAIINKLFPINKQIVSFTTRAPRPGEQEGVDYYFIGPKTDQEIDQMQQTYENGSYLDFVIYNHNAYGIDNQELLHKFDPETTSVAALVTKSGYDSLKASPFGEYVVPVFINVNESTIKAHLQNRNDTPEHIQERLNLYHQEIKTLSWFLNLNEPNFVIDNNGDLSNAIHELSDDIYNLEND